MNKPEYLQNLNVQQHAAVTSPSANLLVLAGAGSGKTRVLTCRIAYLIDQFHLRPSQILAVTFTNKAATEMRNRTLRFAAGADRALIKTFHSFGAYVLRQYALLLNVSPYFTIYDDGDSLNILKKCFPEEPLSKLKLYYHYISTVKNKALFLEDSWDAITKSYPLKKIFTAYQEALAGNNAIDFGDLIYKPLYYLQTNQDFKAEMHRRFKAILVDEYQDTNLAQAKLLRLLSGPDCMVTIVGDEDQSIYRFRGAEPANIFAFKDDFPPTTLIKLEENYRSSQAILNCANHIIKYNRGRIGKTLFTKNPDLTLPKIIGFDTAESEVMFCIKMLSDRNYANSAILYRTNAQSRLFESLFLKHQIPYQLIGTVRFYEREEIKTTLALLTFLLNPYDDLAFERIINKPKRSIGAKSLAVIFQQQAATQGNLLLAAEKALTLLKGKAAVNLASFVTLIHKLLAKLDELALLDFLNYALVESGLQQYYSDSDLAEGTSRVENIGELLSVLSQYGRGIDALNNFLETVMLNNALYDDEDTDHNKVTLITMHNTKGLEYDRVFITGVEEHIFPKIDLTSSESEDELEEERRLFYVAITRARKELYFTYAQRRMLYGKTQFHNYSLFLTELPEEFVEVDTSYLINEQMHSNYAVNNYQVGSFVRHEEYGFGKVVHREVIEEHLMVEVVFTNGKKAKFLPEFNYLEQINPEEIN